jgi:hypothetical protein
MKSKLILRQIFHEKQLSDFLINHLSIHSTTNFRLIHYGRKIEPFIIWKEYFQNHVAFTVYLQCSNITKKGNVQKKN